MHSEPGREKPDFLASTSDWHNDGHGLAQRSLPPTLTVPVKVLSISEKTFVLLSTCACLGRFIIIVWIVP